MKIYKYWQQLDRTHKDAFRAMLLVVLASLISIRINLAETLTEKLGRYESFQLDEMPFLLLFIALGLAWFAWRRMVEQKKEIALRVIVEEKNSQLLAENKSLTQHILKVQEFERLELARDLHDDIGQYLLAIRLDASALTIKGDADHPARRILSNAGHIQGMAKSLMRRLRPAPTTSKNCVDGIHLLVQEWREQKINTQIELHIDEHLQFFTEQSAEKDSTVIEQISVVVYRFIQEALTNIAKHAQAKQVAISLSLVNVSLNAGAQHLFIEIKDDGKGLDVQTASSGMGMIGMRERINAVNGEFIVRSNSPQGLIVRAKIPVNISRANTQHYH